MKKVTFSCLTLATLLQLIPSNGNAANIQVNKKKTNRTEMKQDTIPANSTKKESEEGERNVMLNASDANKPREIQIGLPSEDVNVYENGLPAVYSSTVHKLAAHWRSDSSLGEVGLLSPSESAITTGNIAYSVNSFSKLGQKDLSGRSRALLPSSPLRTVREGFPSYGSSFSKSLFVCRDRLILLLVSIVFYGII